MLATELIKGLLGMGAFAFIAIGIMDLFFDKTKKDNTLPNSFLILAGIALLIAFNI